MIANRSRNAQRVKRRPQNGQAQSVPRLPRLDPEVQFFDSFNNGTYATGGSFINLCGISIGDGASNRDGAVVHPVKLEVKVVLTSSAATFVRVIYGRYLTDMGLASISQILQVSTSPGNLVSPYNRDYNGQSEADRRIEIMYDRTLWLDAATADPHHLVFSTDVSNIRHPLIRWDAAGASTVPIYGGYFALIVADTTSGAYSQASRITFLDA